MGRPFFVAVLEKPKPNRSDAQRAAAVLGLELDGLTSEDVSGAFRRAMLSCHPDRGGDILEAAGAIKAFKDARAVLYTWLDTISPDTCKTCGGREYVRINMAGATRPCPRCAN